MYIDIDRNEEMAVNVKLQCNVTLYILVAIASCYMSFFHLYCIYYMHIGYVWFQMMGVKTLWIIIVRCTCRILRENLLLVYILVNLPS